MDCGFVVRRHRLLLAVVLLNIHYSLAEGMLVVDMGCRLVEAREQLRIWARSLRKMRMVHLVRHCRLV